MLKKTTFIISNHLMFQHGLESLLNEQDGVEILGCASDLEMALEQINMLKPDIVILDSTRLSGEGLSNFAHALHHRVKLISLNLYNNQLTFYQRNQRTAEAYQELGWRVDGVTDLLRAISYNPVT